MEEVFKLSDVPLGMCMGCLKRQTKRGAGGLFPHGEDDEWVCDECRQRKPELISSRTLACQWCTYGDIQHTILGCYICHRCEALNIGQALD
jgi:hypothetical protein